MLGQVLLEQLLLEPVLELVLLEQVLLGQVPELVLRMELGL